MLELLAGETFLLWLETIIYGHGSDEHQNPAKSGFSTAIPGGGFRPGEIVRVGLSLKRDSQKRDCTLRIGTSKPVFQPFERPAADNFAEAGLGSEHTGPTPRQHIVPPWQRLTR